MALKLLQCVFRRMKEGVRLHPGLNAGYGLAQIGAQGQSAIRLSIPARRAPLSCWTD